MAHPRVAHADCRLLFKQYKDAGIRLKHVDEKKNDNIQEENEKSREIVLNMFHWEIYYGKWLLYCFVKNADAQHRVASSKASVLNSFMVT